MDSEAEGRVWGEDRQPLGSNGGVQPAQSAGAANAGGMNETPAQQTDAPANMQEQTLVRPVVIPQVVPVSQVQTPTIQPLQPQPQMPQPPQPQASQPQRPPQYTQPQRPYVPQYPQGAYGYAHQQTTQQPTARQYVTQQMPSAPVYGVPRPPIETPRAASQGSPQGNQKVGLWSFVFGLIGGLVGAAALLLALFAAGVVGKETTTVVQTPQTSQTVNITPESEDITVSQAVAAKALPSVVLVNCTYPKGIGLGSGVILDTDGNIITNYHVIEDANTITVTIGSQEYPAEVVGTDASSDLAVIHADLEGIEVTPIEVGDSSALTVGDWVMTVGSPFGLDQSVSAGIVSSLYRSELMTTESGTTIYANLIQVDAAINPGNSGGALVNSKGQLVGICTLFSSDTESFAGIGFAIAGNYAIDIANRIIAGEPVTHAYIGLSMQTVNEQNAEANGLSVNYGAYVAEVLEDGPAESAGIEVGDIVISLGGKRVTSADSMVLEVRSHSIGETVTVTVMRGDEQLDFEVTLGSDERLQELQAQEREQQREIELQDQGNRIGLFDSMQ